MLPRLTFKFQHWIVAVNVLLVLLLTAAFLALVFGKFQTMAETNAEEKFDLLADKALYQLSEALQAQRSFVEIVSTADVGLAGQSREIDAETLLPMLTRSLRAQKSRYSVYFGLPNDDFLQVIAVRANPLIMAALQAPAGTDDAVRTIRRRSGGDRVEHWNFRAADGTTLEERQKAAEYAPTSRPWYQGAIAGKTTFLTEPYRFASTKELGVTFAAPLKDGRGAFGADVSLNDFNTIVNELRLSANGAMVVLDSDQNILAVKGNPAFYGPGVTLQRQMTKLKDSPSPYIARLAAIDNAGMSTESGPMALEGRQFILASRVMEPLPGKAYRILVLAPLSDFTAVVERTRRDVLLMAALMVLVLIPVVMFSTRRVAATLVALAGHSERLRKLDFSTEPEHVESFLSEVNALGQVQQVMHASISQRTAALEAARKKLAHLVQIGIMLGHERDRDKLLRDALAGARDIAHCSVAIMHVRTAQDTLRIALSTSDVELPPWELPVRPASSDEAPFLASHAALTGETVVIDDIRQSTQFDLSGIARFSKKLGFEAISTLTVPMFSPDGGVIGVVQLFNALDPRTGQVISFDHETVEFIEALASQAAVAFENQNLLVAQRELMEAIIQMLASAIDAKSAYTGGHCERVPELAVMLAEAATKVQEGPLADFGFQTEDQWREFRIGAWLHDCGKVITPEYVVDKATKLETIYNRVHEIRTRFEVLLRDAEIATLRLVAAGQDEASAWADFAQRKQQLQDDFAFVAEANMGGEFMAAARVERIRAIAGETWLRHFDDRLGLSRDEERRHGGGPAPALPVVEHLLADQPQHIVPRESARVLDPKFGFKIAVPRHLYNHGEVYNLCIGRGTLNDEERFKINEHIIYTIQMLENMPFPKNLRRVAEYAGTHHETMAGTGYPRKLDASQLSVPARIMAIADIFEALTASDRPYKKAKSLSDSVRILHNFKKDRHIDPALFDLFLTSGVYLQYAQRFLDPEQLDAVDIGAYLD